MKKTIILDKNNVIEDVFVQTIPFYERNGNNILEDSIKNSILSNVMNAANSLFENLNDLKETEVKIPKDTINISITININEKTLNLNSPENSHYTLTCREKDVIRLIAKGLSNKEAGAELGIKEGRIKNIVSSLLSKIEVCDRTQLAVFAVLNGFV